jgi:hypothetical protein
MTWEPKYLLLVLLPKATWLARDRFRLHKSCSAKFESTTASVGAQAMAVQHAFESIEWDWIADSTYE